MKRRPGHYNNERCTKEAVPCLPINLVDSLITPVSHVQCVPPIKLCKGVQGDHPQLSTIFLFFLQLEGNQLIERTELSTNHVLVYLEKLSNTTLNFSFTVERDIPVQGLKPAQVKVYDYYETDEFAVEEYNAPCTTAKAEQGNA
ncbi:alpha-1-macroglobulin-like [Struthio camelus]|uniref:alpha-1-macroglobulin-like n=1 Tax=Struthio camelus TaxID=8801 RepID=UPI0036040D2D